VGDRRTGGHFPDRESRRTMPKVPPRCNMGTFVFGAEKAVRTGCRTDR
jgi:hypothetical protein